ncbi:MAG: HD domain-containing protein [Syntrophotaleaceae bacterium]
MLGALEIYYDITAEKQGLDKVLASSRLLYSLSGLLFCFAAIILYRASDSMMRRNLAERKLHDINHLLEQKVFAQHAEISITQKTAIEALATLAENYDQDTGSHLARIQEYVRLLLQQLEKSSPYARYMRQQDHYVANIQLASILHDIGKIAVHRKILLKPGRLTPEEFEEVKSHTVVATKVLAKANEFLSKPSAKTAIWPLPECRPAIMKNGMAAATPTASRADASLVRPRGGTFTGRLRCLAQPAALQTGKVSRLFRSGNQDRGVILTPMWSTLFLPRPINSTKWRIFFPAQPRCAE